MPVALVPLALLVVAVSEAALSVVLELVAPPTFAVLAELVLATATVLVVPKPVAVLAENPPVPSVVLVSGAVVAVALVGWAVLPAASWVEAVSVPELEAQELAQAAQPRHQKSV